MENKEKNNGFENLHEWSERMQGAREMLIKLYEDDKMVLPLGVKRSEPITTISWKSTKWSSILWSLFDECW